MIGKKNNHKQTNKKPKQIKKPKQTNQPKPQTPEHKKLHNLKVTNMTSL